VKDKEEDVVGRVYEYFLGKFAASEGKLGGEFYTPKCVVNLIAEMIEPYKGKIYDPCCGSGGMFVQSLKFVQSHHGNTKDISVYGQEFTATTYKLAKMNLAVRGLSANLGEVPADTFFKDQHPDLKADYIMANPPFNQKDWRGPDQLTDDPRWAGYEVPPTGNANYAWVQHFIHHLAPNGYAGFVLANGSMSSNQSGEGEIRQAIVEGERHPAIVLLIEMGQEARGLALEDALHPTLRCATSPARPCARRLPAGPLTSSALRMPPSAIQPLYWLKGVIETWAHIGP